MKDKKDIFWRAYLIYFGFVVLMLVVVFKTVSIQFDGGVNVFSTSSDGTEKMPTRTVERMPRRGQIVDVNYTPLVTSVSFYDIHMDPKVISEELFDKELPNLCIALNELYPEKTAREYERLIRKGRAQGSRYLLIRKKATNEERKKLRKMPIFEKGRLKGGLIDNEETIIRKRPHGELMKRTLGYVRENQGSKRLLVGLEGAYDHYLRGEPGQEVEQKISTGWKRIGPITKEAVEGASVVTTIDKEIQEVAHSELLSQLQNQGAKNGSVIVMDVKTGYVKAIVNLVLNKDGNYYEAYNHAIGTKEVPGSTFKLASLMALLEDGKVRLEDKVNAVGKYEFYDRVLRDSREWGYGEITIQEAFEKSSNVISKVVHNAYKDDPSQFVDRLKSFGLADTLGLEIAGEPEPTMYEPGMAGKWSGISLPWMSIGYEVQQTPMQTLAFYNAVANGGRFMRPRFVKEVRRGNEVVESFDPEVIKESICSDKTLADLQKCLKGVVERGTGSALKSAFFDIAGKTGTALVLNDDLRYGEQGEKRYQASFAGYFPAEEPIYSCIVVISAPSKDIYGATVSGTVFTAIANKVYASSLQYHNPVNSKGKTKELPRVKVGNQYDLNVALRKMGVSHRSEANAEFVVSAKEEGEVVFKNRYVGKETVPNVIGMTAKDAVFLLESAGLHVDIEGVGQVVSQLPVAGGEVVKGMLVEITLK